MSLMKHLREIGSVEDLFELLEVNSDACVLAVHRMRILRRFGIEMERIDRAAQGATEMTLREQYASALATIHEQCARGMREAEPVFRGLGPQLVQLRRGPINGK